MTNQFISIFFNSADPNVTSYEGVKAIHSWRYSNEPLRHWNHSCKRRRHSQLASKKFGANGDSTSPAVGSSALRRVTNCLTFCSCSLLHHTLFSFFAIIKRFFDRFSGRIRARLLCDLCMTAVSSTAITFWWEKSILLLWGKGTANTCTDQIYAQPFIRED